MTVFGHKFRVGDRVTNELNRTFGETIKHGTIVNVYQSYKDHLGEYLILYSVQWDDTGLVEKGYMDIANGLVSETTREETKLD